MKLWLIRPQADRSEWQPWFDKAFGFVVRAETEEEARDLAAMEGGDENPGQRGEDGWVTNSPWRDPRKSTCVELRPDGEEGVVMRDFASA